MGSLQDALKNLENGNADKAISICKKLLKESPNQDVKHILGLSYRLKGNLQKAEKYLLSASKMNKNPSVFNSLGLIYHEKNDHKEAIINFKKALMLNNTFIASHLNLGRAFSKIEQTDEAEKSFRNAIKIKPNLSEAWTELYLLLLNSKQSKKLNEEFKNKNKYNEMGRSIVHGIEELNKGDLKKAEKNFRHALKFDPNSIIIYLNLGIALARQQKTLEATSIYNKVLELNPRTTEAYINLADIIKYENPDMAGQYLNQALSLEPSNPNIHDMIGFTWFMKQQFDKAIKHFNNAIKIDPSYNRAIAHRSASYFMMGKLNLAWKDYMRRYQRLPSSLRPIKQSIPEWRTRNDSVRNLAVWTDQGLGDEILQLGIIADCYKDNIPLTIIANKRLIPIIERSFPLAKTFSRTKVENNLDILNSISHQIPAAGLGKLYRSSFSDFPKRINYLYEDKNETLKIRNKYLRISKHLPLVGISWKSINKEFGDKKSIPLENFIASFKNIDCFFVNLQYGESEEEINLLPKNIRNRIICDNTVNPLTNLNTYANQISALDSVVTTSNTAAHLSGALGKKTWVLIPRIGPGWLWYWFDEHEDSLWYPSMRILRQNKNGDWRQTLTSAKNELSDFLLKRT